MANVDVSGAFRTDLTDLGVCFTFNHKEPFLTVNESGKKDYDYPNNEKVSLECTMFFVPLHIQFLEPLWIIPKCAKDYKI